MVMAKTAWLSALLLSGCVSFGNERIVDRTIIEQIHVGQTQQTQVLALLGEPDDRRSLRVSGYEREWWQYRYRASVVNPLAYVMLTGFFVSGIGMPDRDTVFGIFFDSDGIVRSAVHLATDYQTAWPSPQLTVTSTTTTAVWIDRPVHFEDSTRWPLNSH